MLTNNLYPFYLPFINLLPENAKPLGQGNIRLSISNNYGNTFNLDVDGMADNFLFDVDTESSRTAINFDVGVTNKIDIGLEATYLIHYGGIFDSIIQKFHNFFGVPNARRNEVENNQFALNVENKNGIWVDMNKPVSGFGDITQSLVLSPSSSKEGGITWGVGPILSYPTASNNMGIGKFGMGPSIVALQIKGPRPYGILANHLWGFGNDVSATFIQPILDYTSKKAVTYELTTEMTYDWATENWSIPLIFTANKLVTIGKQMFMIGGGARYWADNTPYNPQNWGFNVSLYVLFPK